MTGGIVIVLRVCERKSFSLWRFILGLEKGNFATYYTFSEKIILILLSVVSLGMFYTAMVYFK